MPKLRLSHGSTYCKAWFKAWEAILGMFALPILQGYEELTIETHENGYAAWFGCRVERQVSKPLPGIQSAQGWSR
jgi:hypothetical protein